MRYSLTIVSDNATDVAEMAKLLASISGVAINATIASGPMPVTHDDEDDESGDTTVAVGAVDKNGLPWDDRIHSTPAKLTAKGIWRAKRGVNPALVTQVESELRMRLPTPVPQQPPQFTPPTDNVAIPQQQPVPMQPVPPQMQPTPVPMQPVPPQMQPTPVPQMPPNPQPVQIQQPVPVQTGPLDFNGFMQKIQVLLQHKDASGAPFIDAPYLATVAQRVGAAFNVACNSITDLSVNQQFIDYAVQIMQHDQRWA